jgi:hypothetical protein
MRNPKSFLFLALVFFLLVVACGSGHQKLERESERLATSSKQHPNDEKMKPGTEGTEGFRDTEPFSGRKPCTSDEECGEGFSCWHEIPRGPSAGIPGSKEKPGKCWSNNEILRMF